MPVNENKPRDARDTIDLFDGCSRPLLAIFGETDHDIPLEHVGESKHRLTALGKAHEVYAGAGHAFFNDRRPQSYDAGAAAVARTRLRGDFAAHLRRQV